MVDRRSLLKSSVLTLAGATLHAAAAGEQNNEPNEHSATLSAVFPGIWKATIGVPERYPLYQAGLCRLLRKGCAG